MYIYIYIYIYELNLIKRKVLLLKKLLQFNITTD